MDLSKINIVTTIAAAPGSSVSVLLNEKSEAVGILFTGGTSESNGVLAAESQYLQLDFALMKNIWKQLVEANGLR